MYDVCIRLIDLPLTVKGTTVLDDDGGFSVYLNSKLSFEEQRLTCEHELRHIACNHFYNNQSVAKCESEANNPSKDIKVVGEYNRILVK